MAESPKVPDAASVANKWASRIAVSTGEYTKGVMKTGDWQSKTSASNENFKAGVARAVANDSFKKGVDATSNSDWQNKTAASASGWSSGASAAKGDMQSAVGKVLSVIGSVSMTDRGPKGTNYGRVQEVGEALRKAKEAGQFQ